MPLHFISPGTKSRWDKILSMVCSGILYYNCSRVIRKMLAITSYQFGKFRCCYRQIWKTVWKLPRKNRLWFFCCYCLFGWMDGWGLLSCGVFCLWSWFLWKVIARTFKLSWGTEIKTEATKYFWTFFIISQALLQILRKLRMLFFLLILHNIQMFLNQKLCL